MDFKYYAKSFIASFVVGIVIILGVIGVAVIELENSFGFSNEIMTMSALQENAPKKTSEKELSGLQRYVNEFMGIRQLMWIADNPVIRLERQIFYIIISKTL